MKSLKIGIIGLGSTAQTIHIPLIKKLKNAEIKAVCDINKPRLNYIASKFNISNKYTDYTAFLKDNKFDALFILTPAETHKEIAKFSINYCDNLFIEKPLSANLKDAKEILDFAAIKKTNVFVGMNLRFRPDSMFLKTLIDNQSLKNPYLLRIGHFISNISPIQLRKEKNNIFFELGLPAIDLGMWLLSYPEIASVSANAHFFNKSDVADACSVFIKTKNNVVLSLDLSRNLTNEKQLFYCNYFSESGYAFLNPLRISRKSKGNEQNLEPIKYLKDNNQFLKSYENEINYFISTVNGLVKPVNPFKEILDRMNLIEAVLKSQKIGKEIVLKK